MPLCWLTLTPLYHTKLKQLIVPTSHLVSMSCVVEDDFFLEDVLDLPTGCSPGVLFQDVNSEGFSKLEKQGWSFKPNELMLDFSTV